MVSRANRHSAVLGRSALGDVESGHDLEPARDGRLLRRGDRPDAPDDAVDPCSYLERAKLGREVDVGRAESECSLDGLVHLHDRRRVQICVVHVHDSGCSVRLGLVAVDHVDCLLVDERDRRIDRLGRGDTEANRYPEGEPQLVPMKNVGRIRDRDEQRVIGEESDGDSRVPARERLGKQRRRLGVDVRLLELDERHLDLLGEQACNLRPGDASALDENLTESFAGLALLFERRLELFLGQEAVAHEQGAERRPGLMSGFHPVEISASRPSDVSGR